MTELGWKWRAEELQLNTSIYRGTFDNFQVFQFIPLGANASVLSLRNAAKVQTQGLEIEAQWAVTPSWQMGLSGAYNEATFVSFPNGGGVGIDLANNVLPDAPRTSYSLHSSWTWGNMDEPWTLLIRTNYKSSVFTNPTNNPTTELLPARHEWFIRLNHEKIQQNWGMSLWIENAFDDQYLLSKNRDFFGHILERPSRNRQVVFQWRKYW